MAKQSTQKPNIPASKAVEYVPPTIQEIDRYVGEVCTQLAHIDAELNTLESRHELSNFVRVIAGLCAKLYTRHGKLLDTNPE